MGAAAHVELQSSDMLCLVGGWQQLLLHCRYFCILLLRNDPIHIHDRRRHWLYHHSWHQLEVCDMSAYPETSAYPDSPYRQQSVQSLITNLMAPASNTASCCSAVASYPCTHIMHDLLCRAVKRSQCFHRHPAETAVSEATGHVICPVSCCAVATCRHCCM